MFSSTNYFFSQGKDVLVIKRLHLEYILKNVWERSDDVVLFYLSAYDFFCETPSEFDGATMVKDLNAMPNLDIHAMIHDYIYSVYNVAADLKYKYKADLIYAHEMERMGGSAYATWSRFVGLTVFGLFFIMFLKVTGLRMSISDKKQFTEVCLKFE
jgi:hypothetical protein